MPTQAGAPSSAGSSTSSARYAQYSSAISPASSTNWPVSAAKNALRAIDERCLGRADMVAGPSLYGAAEAGRGPGKNDKSVYAACQPLADVNMFIRARTQRREKKRS